MWQHLHELLQKGYFCCFKNYKRLFLGYALRMYDQNSNPSDNFPSRLIQNSHNFQNENFNSNKYAQNDIFKIKNGPSNFQNVKANNKIDYFTDINGSGSLIRPKK